MRFARRHPTDDALTLARERALPWYRQMIVERHLRGCARCRSTADALEQELADAIRACTESTPAIVDAPRALRERVRRDMDTLGATWDRSWQVRASRIVNGVPPLAGVAASILLALVVVQMAKGPGRPAVTPVEPVAAALPIRALTPGAVSAIDAATVCAARAGSRQRVDRQVREVVLRDYDMLDVAEHEYELDYLITPELGGVPERKNLWPQRYASGVWNARVKDDLERLLPQMVCEGRIELRTAQRDIAENWIAAYQKYFHTDRPILGQAALRDDDDDEENAFAPAIVLRASFEIFPGRQDAARASTSGVVVVR
jgi:hypothetical protein